MCARALHMLECVARAHTLSRSRSLSRSFALPRSLPPLLNARTRSLDTATDSNTDRRPGNGRALVDVTVGRQDGVRHDLLRDGAQTAVTQALVLIRQCFCPFVRL